MAGFEIDILANVKSVQAGAKDVEQSFDKVADSLDDLTRAADKAGDKIDDSLKDGAKGGAKDASREVEKLERSFKEVADTAKRETKQAGDATARNITEGTSKAKREVRELGDEARQNASETFSSFDGSAQSLVDGIQGTFGGIVSSLGPIGAAAGAAGAIGIGLIGAAFDQAGTQNENFKQKVAELGAEFIEQGKKGEVGLDFIVDKLKELATNTDDAETGLDDLRDVADKSGSSYKDLADAYSGATENLDDLWDAADKRQAQMQQELQAAEQNHSASAVELKDMQAKIDAQGKYRDYIGQARDTANEAAEAEKNYGDAGGYAMETRAAAIEAYTSSVEDAVGSYEDFKNAETGAIDPAAYIDSINARIAANANFNDNINTLMQDFGLSYEAAQEVVSQGIDFAPTLQSIRDAGLEQQFADTMNNAVNSGESIVNGTEFQTDVTVNADTKPVTADIFRVTSQKPQTTITANADTRPATSAISQVANANYSGTIRFDADLSRARSQVDSFINQNRTMTITANIVDRTGKPVP